MKLLGGKLLVADLKEFLQNSYMRNHKHQIGKFEYDSQLSDEHIQVYHNPTQVVIVHRGSASLSDFFTDYRLFSNSNYQNNRIRKSKNIIEKVMEKYKGIPITSIGHSLGGFLAQLTDKVFETIGVNSYIPPMQIGSFSKDNEYLVRSNIDVASALAKTQKRKNVTTIPAKSLNLLTEHSYDILNRINQNSYIGR